MSGLDSGDDYRSIYSSDSASDGYSSDENSGPSSSGLAMKEDTRPLSPMPSTDGAFGHLDATGGDGQSLTDSLSAADLPAMMMSPSPLDAKRKSTELVSTAGSNSDEFSDDQQWEVIEHGQNISDDD
ncbi:hypothetical protein LPJ61_002468, partial [Coemansia biformis]